MRVLVVGSYNVGLTVVGERLPAPGETVLGHTFDMGPGGKGSNQAIGARRLGAEVTLVAKVGNDLFADRARDLFEREGLMGPGILETDTHTGVGLILVDDSGGNMIAVAAGANARLGDDDLERLSDLFGGAGLLLCQLEAPPELFVAAARRARATGATVILNPAPAVPLPKEAYRLADLMTPNETELAVLTGMPTASAGEVERAARALLELGVGQVVVTLGERGALWMGPEGSQELPARPVVARDTTGAGDAFNAGLAAGLASGAPMEQAIRLGIRAGAFCVTRLGVIEGLPTAEELDREVPT